MTKNQVRQALSSSVDAFLAHRANKVANFKTKLESVRDEAVKAGFYGPVIDEVFDPVLASDFVKNNGVKVGKPKKAKTVKIKHWNR